MLEQKKIGRAKSAINKEIKIKDGRCRCLICGKDVRGQHRAFHKSHTIPQFCLENIKGEYEGNVGVLQPNILGFTTPFSEDSLVGVNKAALFYAICSECDNKVFEKYESEHALLESEPDELLDAIALKTYLYELYSSYMRAIRSDLQYSDFTDDLRISSFYNAMAKMEHPVSVLDVGDFHRDFVYAKRSYENGYCNYNILFHAVLNYTVPIAAQTSVPVTHDINFEKFQDATDYSSKRLNDLLVGIFPLKGHSVIFLFTRKDSFALKKYRQQFKRLNDSDKLKEIFYLLIRYKNSNYFFSPYVVEVLENENVRRIFCTEDMRFGLITEGKVLSIDMADMEQSQWKENLPSILSREFSMETLRKKHAHG